MPESEPTVLSGTLTKLTAKAKQTVGRLIGDRDLAAEGELSEARVEAANDAARLTADAEQRQREADLAAAEECYRPSRGRTAASSAMASGGWRMTGWFSFRPERTSAVVPLVWAISTLVRRAWPAS